MHYCVAISATAELLFRNGDYKGINIPCNAVARSTCSMLLSLEWVINVQVYRVRVYLLIQSMQS